MFFPYFYWITITKLCYFSNKNCYSVWKFPTQITTFGSFIYSSSVGFYVYFNILRQDTRNSSHVDIFIRTRVCTRVRQSYLGISSLPGILSTVSFFRPHFRGLKGLFTFIIYVHILCAALARPLPLFFSRTKNVLSSCIDKQTRFVNIPDYIFYIMVMQARKTTHST